MNRRKIYFYCVFTLTISTIILIVTGSSLLTMALGEKKIIPFGTLITGTGMISLPLTIYWGIKELRSPTTKINTILAGFLKIIILLGILWIPLSFLLAGNLTFTFSEKETFQGGQVAMQCFWGLSYGIGIGAILTLILYWTTLLLAKIKTPMVFKVKVSTIYKCSLERAFKTPMLCDITKIHTGYGFSPKVTHTTEDENWGKAGSSKKIFVAKSITQKGGFASIDKIIERRDNEYWKIQVNEFQSWMAGFYKFIGDWKTTEIEKGKVLVEYDYSLYASKPQFYLLNWLFAKLFWKMYMKRVLNNIKIMAYNSEPYLYN
ncbi:MAG: hypothetical protein JXQ93_03110 [Flavobacteriaceae bacterium]